MAYVQPNGTIQLFHGLGLTNEYVNTIWFPSKSAQDGMFSQIVVKFFTNQMYSRVNKNTVRVNCVADEIQDCDYMRFQNTRNNISKWYYCFINEINYINEQVTEISYEIDELQTWFLDGTFDKCFVERNHSLTDNIGENIVPEPFATEGNIVVSTPIKKASTGTKYLVVLGARDIGAFFQDLDQNEYGGLASTVHYLLFDSANLHTFLKNCKFANGFVEGLFGADDIWSITSIYAVPEPFFSDGVSKTVKGASCVLMSQFAYAVVSSAAKPSGLSRHGVSGDGIYNPKNAKLFTYPYYYLKISSPQGEQDLKFENFLGSSPACYFTIKTCCNPDPQIVCMPINYNGDEFDYKYSVTVNNFPSLAVYQDTSFGQFIGKAVKVAGAAAISAGVGIAAAGAAQATAPVEGSFVLPAGGDVGNDALQAGLIAGQHGAKIGAENALKGHGSSTDIGTLFATSGIGATYDPVFQFNVYVMGLRFQVARVYDEYLSRYGYAQNRVMKPELNARTNWTYVKTRNCSFSGYCPSRSAKKINTIMNNGITWWDYRTSVGSYGNFDNLPHSVG